MKNNATTRVMILLRLCPLFYMSRSFFSGQLKKTTPAMGVKKGGETRDRPRTFLAHEMCQRTSPPKKKNSWGDFSYIYKYNDSRQTVNNNRSEIKRWFEICNFFLSQLLVETSGSKRMNVSASVVTINLSHFYGCTHSFSSKQTIDWWSVCIKTTQTILVTNKKASYQQCMHDRRCRNDMHSDDLENHST